MRSKVLQKGTVSEKQSTHRGNDGTGFVAERGMCVNCGAWKGELGHESSPSLYVEHLMLVLDGIWKVLKKDGVCFINLGDSYAGSGKGPTGHNGVQRAAERQGFVDQRSSTDDGVKAKSLYLIP
jgi:hypothetical protein